MKESKFSNIIWGLIFLGLGVIFLGNNLNIWDINVFFEGWWTLFIIIPSIFGILKKGNRTSSSFGLIFGILLLLASKDIITFSLISKLFIPIVFIFIGFCFFSKNKKITDKSYKKIEKSENLIRLMAIFSGRDEKVNSLFNGARCSSIFGGIDLDLRNAEIKNDVVIDVFSCFGGIDIIVPNDVNVITEGIPLFGGVETKLENNDKNKLTIYINYVVIFGGIDIK